MAEAVPEESRRRLWPGLLVSALLLAIALRALLPWALQAVVERRASQALGTPVRMGDLDLSLWKGEVVVEDLRIARWDDPGAQALVLRRGAARVDRVALLGGRPALHRLVLDGPRLALARTSEGGIDSGLDLSGAGEGAGARAPALRVGRLEVRDALLRISAPQGESVEITGRLTARDLDAAAPGPVPFAAELHHGQGRLDVTGSLDASAGRADLELEWQDLEGPPLLGVLRPELARRLELRAGRFSGAASVALEPAAADGDGEGARLVLRGRGSARDVDASFAAAGVDAAFRLLEVEAEEVTLPLAEAGAPELVLAHLRVVEPVFRVTPVGAARAPEAAVGAEPAAPAARIAIAALELDGGRVTWVDPEAEGAEAVLADLRVRAQGLRAPTLAFEALDLAASGPGEAPLRASGRLTPADGAFELSAERVELVGLDASVAARSPYRILRGKVSLATTLTLEGAAYRAPARLVLHDLALASEDEGAAFREQFGMSPNLALALLRDARGDIALDLPIEGSRDGARVRLWPVVGGALRTALLNALTTPLSLVGQVVTREGRLETFDFEPVRFAPGEARLAGGAEGSLEPMAALLAERPGLAVELVPLVVSGDARALAGRGDEPAASEALQALARRRAAVVRDALLAGDGVAGARVTVREGPLAISAGSPRIEFAVATRDVPSEPQTSAAGDD